MWNMQGILRFSGDSPFEWIVLSDDGGGGGGACLLLLVVGSRLENDVVGSSED